MEDLEANLVSLLFPHQSSGNIEDLNIKGQKHIYWKRSFNKYFYNLEYTNLHQADIKQLLMDCLYGYRGRELLSALSFLF